MIIGCFNSLFGSDERKKTTKGPMYLEIKGPKSANLASLETMLHQEQMFRKHRVYITSSNSDQVEVVEIRNNEKNRPVQRLLKNTRTNYGGNQGMKNDKKRSNEINIQK